MKIEDLTQLVIKETGLSKKEIEEKVQAIVDELKGLISREGALLIVSKELGVDTENLGTNTKGKVDVITTSSYLQTFNEVRKEMSSENIQPINYHYLRVLSHQDVVRDFVDRFKEVKNSIEKSVSTEITVSIIGSKNSIVMIKGLCKVYDRSRDAFNRLKDIILRYSAEDTGGNNTLKIATRKPAQEVKEESPAKPKKTRTSPTKTIATPTQNTDTQGPFVFDGPIEQFFSAYMDKEEVQTKLGIAEKFEEFIEAQGDQAKLKELDRIPEEIKSLIIPDEAKQLSQEEVIPLIERWLDKNKDVIDIDFTFSEEDPLITKK